MNDYANILYGLKVDDPDAYRCAMEWISDGWYYMAVAHGLSVVFSDVTGMMVPLV